MEQLDVDGHVTGIERFIADQPAGEMVVGLKVNEVRWLIDRVRETERVSALADCMTRYRDRADARLSSLSEKVEALRKSPERDVLDCAYNDALSAVRAILAGGA